MCVRAFASVWASAAVVEDQVGSSRRRCCRWVLCCAHAPFVTWGALGAESWEMSVTLEYCR